MSSCKAFSSERRNSPLGDVLDGGADTALTRGMLKIAR